jgi:hypothetical protein
MFSAVALIGFDVSLSSALLCTIVSEDMALLVGWP